MPNFSIPKILGVPYTTNEGGYNWFEAYAQPKEGYAWSRNPTTGRELKSESRPTFYKTVITDLTSGRGFYKDHNGDLYSFSSDEVPKYAWPYKPYKPEIKDLYGTNNRPYHTEQLIYIFNRLKNAGIPYKQNMAILTNIAEESGGDFSAVDPSKTSYGLLQWKSGRYDKKQNDSIDKQIDYIIDTIYNTSDHKSWTHGGPGSNYGSYNDAYNDFHNSEDPKKILKGFTWGYVRPGNTAESEKNRSIAYDKLSELFSEYKKGGKIHIKPENEGKLTKLKTRTGKTEAELWAEGDKSVRKMITFARNARKWNK